MEKPMTAEGMEGFAEFWEFWDARGSDTVWEAFHGRHHLMLWQQMAQLRREVEALREMLLEAQGRRS